MADMERRKLSWFGEFWDIAPENRLLASVGISACGCTANQWRRKTCDGRCSGNRTPRLFPSSAIFGDIHDLVLKNKKIGSAFARQPHHVLVVIFYPAADSLTIHQLHANRLLLLAQSLKEAASSKVSSGGGVRPRLAALGFPCGRN